MGCGASTAAAPVAAPDTPQVEKRAEPPAPAPAAAAPEPAPAPPPVAATPEPPAEDAAPAAAGPALPGGAMGVGGDPKQESAAAQIYYMLQKQEGKSPVDATEAGRYLKAMVMCYKLSPPPPPSEVQALTADGGTMDKDAFVAALGKLPTLLAAAEADWDAATGKFTKFRSCEDQLSKLLGNLDRLRQKQARGENVDDQIASRKKQVKKFRSNGIVPSPALCVFNQIDVDKGRTISSAELIRAFKGLKKVYPASDAEVEDMLKKLDTDGSGEIDEDEWIRNLDLLPALKAALASDLDPDTGKLRSYRSPRQQFAKLLGNIDRIEYDISRYAGGVKDPERVKMAKELQSRRAQADRMRLAGIHPSAGIVVFNQIDKKKTGQITKEDLTKLFNKMDGFVRDDTAKAVDSIMAKLDADKNGTVSEKEWLEGLDHVQDLKMALQKDIDPETGKLRCMITSGKAIFDMLRRQEGVWAVDKNEVGRYLKCLNAVYKPDNGSMSMEVDDKADELIEAGKVRFIPAACCAR
jgi:Ca2+-binding EF-hand superfamily protein|eukprot:COSAG06_NODE_2640_length_6527_cov_67.332141_1_plen_523_part_00